ncbi:MAG: DUF2877 domain-containing protein [Ktedonobacteraceae bacterium]
MCLVGALMGAARRGVVHSAFATAANLVFPADLLVSLNADARTLVVPARALPFPGMPNGIQVNGFPFSALRPGMPVLLGAGRIVIDAIGCSLDLSGCMQWDARIVRPVNLDADVVRKNAAWLEQQYLTQADDACHQDRLIPLQGAINQSLRLAVADMARALCGRGRGLTPSGDDMLAGWMAINWLLYGPPYTRDTTLNRGMGLPGPLLDNVFTHIPEIETARRAGQAHAPTEVDTTLIAACEEILAVARRQTHLLSQSWLGYAARGCVAMPVRALLEAMTGDDERQLAAAAQVVLSMGATSGHDLMRGIVMGVRCGGPYG